MVETCEMANMAWIFFDVGSTLINEDRFSSLWDQKVHKLLEVKGVSWNQYLKVRREVVVSRQVGAGGYRAIAREVFRKFFGDNKVEEGLREYDQSSLAIQGNPGGLWDLYSDVKSALRECSAHFSIGIIANQQTGARKLIEEWRILSFFKAIALSEDVGFRKPDPHIFKYALGEAHCHPKNAVMVGDRLDNDIAPANKLGMKTIHVVRGRIYNVQTPITQLEIPNISMKNLRGIGDVAEKLLS